jgi:DNA-binding transcriptional LysR family regulator
MDTKQLRTFATIVDLASFTRAARRLNLSQSAISQQISALERQVGVKLVARTGAGARPTAAGDILLHYARQILAKIDEAERVLADYEHAGGGVLRIGAGGAACHYLLPSVLKEFHDRFPKVELRVVSGHTRLTLERLHEGELDVGVLTLPVSQPKLRILDLGRDELVAIVAPSHPWAERKRIQASEFAGQPLLIYERRSQTFALIERVLLETGVFPQIAMEMDHLEAVVGMVRVGLGVAIVPRWAVRAETASGYVATVSIGKTGLGRGWGLGFREANHQLQTLKAFARLCTERLPQLLTP